MRLRILNALAFAIIVGAVSTAVAQPAGRRAPGGRIPPSEVQGLFDAYTLVQAQEALELSDSQYAPFVTRMKSLQDMRRRHQRARMRLLRQLAEAVDRGSREGALREGLEGLHEHDTKAAEELRNAYREVDEVLDLKQQVRFRVFEDRMEQRKFELLMRARQRQQNRERTVSPRRNNPRP